MTSRTERLVRETGARLAIHESLIWRVAAYGAQSARMASRYAGLHREVLRHPPPPGDRPLISFVAASGLVRLGHAVTSAPLTSKLTYLALRLALNISGVDAAARVRFGALVVLTAALVHLGALLLSRPAAIPHQYVPTMVAGTAAAIALFRSDFVADLWNEWCARERGRR